MPIRTRKRLCVATAAVLGCALLAGCGPEADGSSKPPGAGQSAPATAGRHSTRATPSPSPSPTVPAAAAPSTIPVPRPATLQERLLAGADVPASPGGVSWADGRTSDQEPGGRFGTCQKFAMTSIGAMRVAVRQYTPRPADAHASAGELVAQFADPNTAARAFEVLKAWRAQCDEELARHHDHHVGALQEVSVPEGAGGWYELTYGPVEDDHAAHWVDAQGLARVGNRIALVSLARASADSAPTDARSMATLVRDAAGRLS